MYSEVFFVVVTFNGMNWIDKCIKSIYLSKGCNIIVVDNCSTDNTVKYIKENFPKIYIIELKENVGFGAANNIGIKLALTKNCKFVFLLNQDAYLTVNTVSNLLKTFHQIPNIGILSPLHLNGAGTSFDKGFLNYLYFGSEGEFVNSLYFDKPIDVFNVPFVNAAAWLLSRNCIEKVGLFENLFYHYGEDNNYCQRVLYHGFIIAISLNAVALHDREWRNGMAPEFIAKEELKFLLINLCDPLKNPEEGVNNYIKIKRKQLMKLLIKLDFKGYKKNKIDLNFIKERKATIIKNTIAKKEPYSTDFKIAEFTNIDII